jgi:hypothetical protein
VKISSTTEGAIYNNAGAGTRGILFSGDDIDIDCLAYVYYFPGSVQFRVALFGPFLIFSWRCNLLWGKWLENTPSLSPIDVAEDESSTFDLDSGAGYRVCKRLFQPCRRFNSLRQMNWVNLRKLTPPRIAFDMMQSPFEV